MLEYEKPTKLPAGHFWLTASFDMFSDAKCRMSYHPGLTIMDLANNLQLSPAAREHASFFVEDVFIPQNAWGAVRPKSGVNVYLKLTPAGPAIGALIAAIAGALVKAALISAAVAPIIATVIGAVVTIAVSSLFSPAPPQSRASQPQESPTLSISSARNSENPFGPVPSVLGTHKIVPPYGAPPYTEVVGDDQYLRFVVVWGYGPVSVSDIKIGNTLLSNFESVESEHDFTGGAALTLYPQNVRQENLAILLNTSYQSRTTEIQVDEIGVTVTWPQGLLQSTDQGRKNHSITLYLQYRVLGASSWVTWVTETVTDSTAQVKRWSKRLTGLTRAQYEIQVKTSEPNVNDGYYDTVQWTALRSFLNEDPIQNPLVAKSAFRIKASDQLSGIVDQLNGIVSTKIPTWNGSTWTGATASSNPAAIYRYILTGAPNKSPMSAGQIDDVELGDWYNKCATAGYHFEQVIDFRTSVSEILQSVAAAGFASPRISDADKQSVLIDEVKTTVVQHFSPRNTSGFQGRVMFAEIPHGLRCRFFNRDRGYIEDERIVYDDGYTSANATDFQTLDLPGQTYSDNVYKMARHFIASGRLRPEEWVFTLDFEHLIATRGDLVRITHDVAQIGQASGRVKTVVGDDFTFDELVTIASGTSYTFRFRKAGGATTTKTFTAASSTTTATLTLTGVTGVAAGDLFQFGMNAVESVLAQIRSIEPADDLEARVVCVPYNADIFNASATIPDYTSVISEPVSLSFEGPQTPWITNLISGEEALQKSASGDITPAIMVYFQSRAPDEALNRFAKPARYFQARWRRTDSNDPWDYTPQFPADSRSIMLQPVATGIGYDVAVRAIHSDDKVSAFYQETNHVVIGASALPPTVDTFVVNAIGVTTYVEWTYPSIPIDCVGFEIRFSPVTDITQWRELTVIASGVSPETRSFTVPSREGTYAIKPIDVLGNRSKEALFINTTMIDPEPVKLINTYSEDPAWSGTLTQLFLNTDGDLQLNASEVMADWDLMTDVLTLYHGEDGVFPVGYYDFGETDLGAVYTTRAVWDAVVDASQVANFMAAWPSLAQIDPLAGDLSGDATNVVIEANHSIIDGVTPTYLGWRPFIVGEYTARHIKFRAKLSTTSTYVTPTLKELEVRIDARTRTDHGEDVSSGSVVQTINVSPKMIYLASIGVGAQNMQTGDYYQITNKTRGSFDIGFYDSSDVLITRTFDYNAVGYGREMGT